MKEEKEREKERKGGRKERKILGILLRMHKDKTLKASRKEGQTHTHTPITIKGMNVRVAARIQREMSFNPEAYGQANYQLG